MYDFILNVLYNLLGIAIGEIFILFFFYPCLALSQPEINKENIQSKDEQRARNPLNLSEESSERELKLTKIFISKQ